MEQQATAYRIRCLVILHSKSYIQSARPTLFPHRGIIRLGLVVRNRRCSSLSLYPFDSTPHPKTYPACGRATAPRNPWLSAYIGDCLSDLIIILRFMRSEEHTS